MPPQGRALDAGRDGYSHHHMEIGRQHVDLQSLKGACLRASTCRATAAPAWSAVGAGCPAKEPYSSALLLQGARARMLALAAAAVAVAVWHDGDDRHRLHRHSRAAHTLCLNRVRTRLLRAILPPGAASGFA